MRIGVTGSTGFIGEALVSALESRSNGVVRFVRPDSRGVVGETIRWNPTSQDIDERDVARVGELDAIVHLGGSGIADKRWNDQRKFDIKNSRVLSTRLLAEAMASSRLSCSHLVSGSAIGYYGSGGDDVLDEDSPAGKNFLATVCVEWEQATKPLIDTDATVCFLRTGVVLARNGGALKKQLPLFRAGLGGTLSNGHQWMSPISLNDEVRAIIFTLEQRLKGPINLVCPTPITNAEFTRVLAQMLRRPALLTVPTVALKIALGAELVDQALLASQRIVPARLIEAGFKFDSPDSETALRTIL